METVIADELVIHVSALKNRQYWATKTAAMVEDNDKNYDMEWDDEDWDDEKVTMYL